MNFTYHLKLNYCPFIYVLCIAHFVSRPCTEFLCLIAGELTQLTGCNAIDRGIQSSLPSLAGESLAARLHVQGVPLDLGEYNFLNFQALCQRVTKLNLNLRIWAWYIVCV